MKWTLIIVAISMYSLHANSDLDTVKQLLTDLKTNVQLDIEALDAAWELHKKNKQSVIDGLGFSTQEQRSECQKKDEDVESKKRDIKITNDFVAWMEKRQRLNSNRLGVLEQNRCQSSNNYVHDIKNYKIALALVKFLREQLDKLDQNASPAQKQEFLQKVTKFVQIYQTGKLLTMVENLQINNDGSYVLPTVEGDEYDLNEAILSSTRGKRNANKVLLQQQQTTVIASGDGDDKADSAVVLIPSQCDDSINTVIVVQNDDGTNSDDDLHIKFTNGGSSTGGHTKPKPAPKPHVDPVHQEDTTGEESGSHSTDNEGEDDEETEEQGTNTEEQDDNNAEEQKQQDDNTEEQGETTGDDDGNEEGDHSDAAADDGSQKGGDNGSGSNNAAVPEEAEDLSDIRKVLDAIEKHSKKSLDLEQEDEVRSSMIYIDFKLHIELENQYFDKQIAGEKENLIKLTNQLTNRVSVARQCNARLKQISIAFQVSQDDYNDSYQHYLELRKSKEDELATFEDIYRIYTNQVV
ncbi:unnamed protein product (macronuclear) [Paramecium tetraurelia]|uniref:Uncharacterized protein n=1 Tax=Paramecium tetraurelia TaxID=5888 RepID=A0CBE4_PARTE|nr:uncharacterized protein GSPATT00036894001 [Paramecium tetraurelia]CAK68111.1 unnamed protein product [Paramecium tetraurelia]|eukprot:XP_001435508.1 hypothetical protein (macronuclear) [Paramecium tetraurelia strain d4-2]